MSTKALPVQKAQHKKQRRFDLMASLTGDGTGDAVGVFNSMLRQKFDGLVSVSIDQTAILANGLADKAATVRPSLDSARRQFLTPFVAGGAEQTAQVNAIGLRHCPVVAQIAGVQAGQIDGYVDQTGGLRCVNRAGMHLVSDSVDSKTLLIWRLMSIDRAAMDWLGQQSDPSAQGDFAEILSIHEDLQAKDHATQVKDANQQADLQQQLDDAQLAALYEEYLPKLANGEDVDPEITDAVLRYHETLIDADAADARVNDRSDS